MRVISIAIAAVLAVGLIWSITPTAGKAPHPTFTMDPLPMMAKAPHTLPVEQYDQGTIF